MKQISGFFSVFVLLVLFFSELSFGYDALVKKQIFELPSYTTVSGQKLDNVKIGFETYGSLNSERSNVIFIAHHYSGNSHAAGKYKADDKLPGYWDSIIGSGKPIDTDKYFVVSADTLVNLYPNDPNVQTTGPATLNPATGNAYGRSFPLVVAKDFVRVHRMLLATMGIQSLEAVIGASGGSMQAFEWAVSDPDFVKRVVAVITPGLSVVGTPAQTKLLSWARAVFSDPAYKAGFYEPAAQPVLGLSRSLALTSFHTNTFEDEKNNWAQKVFNRPWEQVTDQQKIELFAPKMKTIDANHVVYTVAAYQNYNLIPYVSKIKARVLMIQAASDKLFPPSMAETSRNVLLGAGVSVEPVFVIQGTGAHLDGILQITQAKDVIEGFLADHKKDQP